MKVNDNNPPLLPGIGGGGTTCRGLAGQCTTGRLGILWAIGYWPLVIEHLNQNDPQAEQ